LKLKPIKLADLDLECESSSHKALIKKAHKELISLNQFSGIPSCVFNLLKKKEAFDDLQKTKDCRKFLDCLVLQKPQNRIEKKYANCLRALYFIESHQSLKIDHKLILKLHSLIQHALTSRKSDIGHYRNRQNWIGPEGCHKDDAYFFPPKASEVRKDLEMLFDSLDSSTKDPLLQLAEYFSLFLIIHPFMDGNGRVIRSLCGVFLKQKMILISPILLMSSYFKKNRLRYFETLYEITEFQDQTSWIKFFLNGLIESARLQYKMMKKLSALYKKLLKLVDDHDLVTLIFQDGCLDLKKTRISKDALLRLKETKLFRIYKKRWVVFRDLPKIIKD
jgi:fido (protein-threonine AMPylation protein)